MTLGSVPPALEAHNFILAELTIPYHVLTHIAYCVVVAFCLPQWLMRKGIAPFRRSYQSCWKRFQKLPQPDFEVKSALLNAENGFIQSSDLPANPVGVGYLRQERNIEQL